MILELEFYSEHHISKEQVEFQKGYVKHVRNNMKFKNDIITKAEEKLSELAKEQKLDPKKVTFIGIHARKTDHAEFMMKNLNMKPIGDEYFNNAIKYYQKSYDNCIFIVGSDDIDWCKKNIDSSKANIFFSDSRDPIIYFNGSFDEIFPSRVWAGIIQKRNSLMTNPFT